jgi:PhnB protein
MIKKSQFILYVENQSVSTEFYSKLLNQEPILNVPGMTEFKLTENSILGLIPVKGIKKLLENKIETSITLEDNVKSELYILVDNIEEYFNRAISLKVTVLSEIKERDWGHRVAYFLDLDNYIVALAEEIELSAGLNL